MTKMNRTAAVVALALVVVFGVVRMSAQSGYDLFQKALAAERADGNVAEAIKLYERIVKDFTSDHALMAKTLLRLGECYQKLGDAESQKIYERIVREFSDQKEEVALARARLGGSAVVASAKGDRTVWTGNVWPYGRVSPDGRFITGRAGGGGLSVHDVGANVDRTLTPDAVPYYAQWTRHSAISRDGKQVVYEWWDGNKGWRLAFRIAALPRSGFLEPREFFLANDDVLSLASFDWSPDGKWIAAAIRRKDRTGQIALIAVADGSFRVLKSMDWNVPERIFFSLDSRYIAFDLPATDTNAQPRPAVYYPAGRDVFVLAIDGSRQTPAVVDSANKAVMGWSPDGTRLLFSSDRTGSVGLWALPFADGKTQGSPELLKPDIGASVSLGLTVSGALYVHKRMSTRDITIAPIDLAAGKLIGPPVGFTQGFVGDPRNPSWSPDGKYLAYACEDGTVIAIRSVTTGQVRLLPRSLNYVQALDWSPDGRSLLTRTKGTDLKGRDGIFRIDAQSGEAMAVILGDFGQGQWSPDSKKVYYSRRPPRAQWFERDLASGAERELPVGGVLSPDGQYFALQRQDQSPRGNDLTTLLLVPVAGGQPREVLHLTQPEAFRGGPVWMPDSRAVIIAKDTGSRRELWLVPVAGGRPRKLEIDPDIWMEGAMSPGSNGFSLSPDGRSIAFQVGKTVEEVWALENFLPAANAKK